MIKRRITLWTTAGAMVATGFATGYVNAAGVTMAPHENDPTQISRFIHLAAGEGEGEGASQMKSESEFLHALGLVEGHMTVGSELYAAGETKHAQTHMKHPRDEIYTKLLPLLKQRNAPGFDKELAAVADAVSAGKPGKEVLARMDDLRAALERNGKPSDARERLMTIARLVRTAAQEYAIGVKDGKIVNAHEYQDAYGFTKAARRLLTTAPATEQEKYAKQFSAVGKYLAELDSAWPDIAGNKPVKTDPSLLAANAARIEIEALSVK